MLPICDYHMHTPLCGHAQGEPQEYAQHAIQVGLEEIGFSDHAPLVSHVDPSITMSFAQLPGYQKMISDLQQELKGKLRIKIALGADFLLGDEEISSTMLKDFPYDYVIGSVHYIDQWGFDNPAEKEAWDKTDSNQVYRKYYKLLRQSAQSGMFDIMAHVDLVKKFGHRPTEDLTDEVKETAKVFKGSGVAVEINTSGLRKPVKEMYPALDALKCYAQAGVPLTFGSDAHTPQDVGKDFDKAVDLAKAAGYSEYVLFKQRQIERTIKL